VTVQLNHMIVPAKDARVAATWLAEMLGLPEPIHWGPFWQVSVANGVDIDFDEEEPESTIRPLHLAFLISDDEFDGIYGRIQERGIVHYADPMGRERNQINHNDGGRGVYFPDPNGHWLEVITRPYGG